MSALSTEKVTHLALGDPAVDRVFHGFKIGDFAVLHGNAAFFISSVLSVRCQLSAENSGLNSSVVFADGGNSFDPYLVAEIARGYGLDPRSALKRIYISRVFTAYQFSSLILEKLGPFLKRKKAKLLVVSNVSSLFLDRDIPKSEAKDLFMKICTRLSEIAADQQAIVIVSYFPKRKSVQGLFFEAFLLGKSNVLTNFKRAGRILTFALEDHMHLKFFTMNFSKDYTPLMALMEA
jgi:hypothetical protein